MTAQKIFVIFTTVLFFFLPTYALAQNIDQIAYNVEVKGDGVQNGDIVSYQNRTYQPAKKAYDPAVYGVVVNNPALVFNSATSTTRAVITQGQAQVRVSTKNGTIKLGDLITTSDTPGIGQKATKSGYILGKALSDFPPSGSNETSGEVMVLISINYSQVSAQAESLTTNGLDQVAKKVASALVTGNLPNLIKYIFALLLGSISFFVGLYHFVRSNRTAVESIARNPMAKKDIQRQLWIGTSGILLASGAGLAIAVFIIFFL